LIQKVRPHCAKTNVDWLGTEIESESPELAPSGRLGLLHLLSAQENGRPQMEPAVPIAFHNLSVPVKQSAYLQQVQSAHSQLAPQAQPAPHGQLQVAFALQQLPLAGCELLAAIPPAASAAIKAADANNLTNMRKLLVRNRD
jgi:hypothetical protein